MRAASCLLAAAFVLLIHVLTLAPTVTGEDSGELIAAAYHFGVPHPPGYPLWTILCGIWLHVLPFGNIAWRANLFSAVCTAAAVFILAAVLRRMGFRPLASCAAAAVAGLTAAVWSQSVITEVYALNLLMIALLMWLVVRWHQDRQRQWLVWAALVVGLGMCNHHTMGLAALGLALWAVAREPNILKDVRLLVRCVIALALGLAPHVYLLWAARRNMPVNWGETTTLAALWEHVGRGQYKSKTSVDAPIDMTLGLLLGRLFYAVRWLTTQFTPILIPLIAAGFIWLYRRRVRRPLFWLVVTMWACGSALFCYLEGPRLDRQDEFVHKVFHTPMALVFAIPLAAGLHWGLTSMRAMRGRLRPIPVALFSLVAAMGVVAVPLLAHWRENNMRNYWYASDHARNMLACMQPNSIIFPSGDHNTFPLIYLIHVEGFRPDVTIADKYGYVDPPLYAGMPDSPGKPRTLDEREAIEKWVIRSQRRPVYYTVKKTPRLDATSVVHVGLLYHLLPDGKQIDARSCWAAIGYRNLEGLYAPEDLSAMNILSDYHYARAVASLEEGDVDAARVAFASTVGHAWGMKEIHNNVASAMADHGLVDEAIAHYEAAARMDWRYVPARWNLARIFQNVGRHEWAARVYEDITRAAPGDYRPYGELGFLFRDHFGTPSRARYWMYESLRINPVQPQIIEALAQMDAKVDAPVDAQVDATNGAKEVHSATPREVTPNPGLQVSATQIDLGKVLHGDESHAEVLVENAGDEQVRIEEVRTSCACLQYDLEDQRVEPGQARRLRIAFDARSRGGPFAETLTLVGDDLHRSEVTIRVRGEALPILEVAPKALLVSALPGRRPQPVTLVLSHNGGVEFTLTGIEASLEALSAAAELDAPSARHEIAVEWNNEVRSSEEGRLLLSTSLADHSTVAVPIRIAVESPARVYPSIVYLGLMQRQERATREVIIEAVPQIEELDLVLDAGSLADGLRAELQSIDADRRRWRLGIDFEAAAAQAGRLEARIPVHVGGSDVTLEVPVHVVVADE